MMFDFTVSSESIYIPYRRLVSFVLASNPQYPWSVNPFRMVFCSLCVVEKRLNFQFFLSTWYERDKSFCSACFWMWLTLLGPRKWSWNANIAILPSRLFLTRLMCGQASVLIISGDMRSRTFPLSATNESSKRPSSSVPSGFPVAIISALLNISLSWVV